MTTTREEAISEFIDDVEYLTAVHESVGTYDTIGYWREYREAVAYFKEKYPQFADDFE